MKRYSLRHKILYIVLGFTIISQVIYLYFNIQSFQRSYDEVVRSNLMIVGTTLSGNLNFILKKNIPINSLFGLKKLFDGFLSDAPYLASIAVTDIQRKCLYYCDRNRYLDGKALKGKSGWLATQLKRDAFQLEFALSGVAEAPAGKLLLRMDQSLVFAKVKEIALDTGTIILITVLSIFDFLLFIVAFTIVLPVRVVTRELELDLAEGRLDLPVHRTGIDFFDIVVEYFDAYRCRLKDKWIQLSVVARSFLEGRTNETISPSKDDLSIGEGLLKRFASLVATFSVNSSDRDVSISDPVLIRPAIFLFVFAESLSISFLPLFAKELYAPIFNLSEEVVVGLPISAFMFFTAVSLPLGGALSDIVGRRKAFLAAAVISAAGLILTGSAQSIIMLIIYRSIVGIGFGMVYMTVQGYIIDTTRYGSRAEGMAIFLSAFYGGTLCGSAIGGMIAERTGFRFLFFVGAALTLISVLFLYRYLSFGTKSAKAQYKHPKGAWLKKTVAALPSLSDFGRLMSNRNFIAISVFQAIPNKICLIGFVYYLAPLFLQQLGTGRSDTGRYIMGYSLVMILLSQTMSKWSDQRGNIKQLIFIGGILSGVIFIPFIAIQNAYMVALGIFLLGAVHSFSVSNQAKLASQLKAVEAVGAGSGLGVYRQVERMGNVLAPVLLGTLVSVFSYAYALAIIGAYTALSSVLFLFIYKEEQEV